MSVVLFTRQNKRLSIGDYAGRKHDKIEEKFSMCLTIDSHSICIPYYCQSITELRKHESIKNSSETN